MDEKTSMEQHYMLSKKVWMHNNYCILMLSNSLGILISV